MSLSKNAMLVRLSISQWYNQALDKKIAGEVAVKYDQETSTDKYIKTLLPDESVAAILKTIGKMRTFHYKHTMPWQDGGMRILPSGRYFEYVNGMRALKDEFESGVDVFVKEYRNWKEKARASRKGMYNEEDYPLESSLRDSFEVRTTFYPIPDSGDFRVDLEQEEIEKIKAGVEKDVKASIDSATQHLYGRLHKAVLQMYSCLVDPKKVIRESTLVNLAELVEMIPSLNIGSDALLTLIAEGVANTVCQYGIDTLKDDKDIRAKVAQELGEVLNELKAKTQGGSGV